MAGNNPYSFGDDFLDDLNDDKSEESSSDDLVLDGHIISSDNRCPKCNQLHNIPGMNGLPKELRVGLSKLLGSVLEEKEQKSFASLLHVNLTAFLRRTFYFIFERTHFNRFVMDRVVVSTIAQSSSIAFDVLVKLYHAEFLLVTLKYERSFIDILDLSSNVNALRFGSMIDENGRTYIHATAKMNKDKIDYLIDIVTKQYTSLAEQHNYIVNDSYLQNDVSQFKPQDDFDRNYLLLAVRDRVEEILDELKRERRKS